MPQLKVSQASLAQEGSTLGVDGCTRLLHGSQLVIKAFLPTVLWAQIFLRDLMGSDSQSEAELDDLLVLGMHIV